MIAPLAQQDRSSGAGHSESRAEGPSSVRARQIASWRRAPLVYATTAALSQARSLLPAGTLLEHEIGRAIARGDVNASQRGGFVFLDEHGLVARCVREPGRLRPRPRSWTVVDVARHRGSS